MTTTIPRPDTLVARLPEAPCIDAYQVGLRRLRAAVAGDDEEWPRSLAMAWLSGSDFPNKHRDYEQVLHDPEAGIEARCLAAHYLGRIAHPAVQGILVAGLCIEDDQVRSAVLAALARAGGPAAFEAIRGICGTDGDRSAFALAAIACRHDLGGIDLAANEATVLARCPGEESSSFRIESASPAEVELCLRCLGPQPFSIELAEQPAHQIRCGNDFWLILFSRVVATANRVDDLRGRKHFVAIVAKRVSPDGRYAEAFIVLAAPAAAEEGGRLIVYRASGSPVMAGSITFTGAGAEFRLRSMPRPGAFTIDIDGVFQAGGLEISNARLGPGKKQEPTRTSSPLKMSIQSG